MELSEEVYYLDSSREWTLSSQTTQHVDNRTLAEKRSLQLFKASVGRQALRGPAAGGAAAAAAGGGALPRHHLRPRLAGAGQVLRLVGCADALRELPGAAPGLLPAGRQGGARMAFTAWQGQAFFYKNARSVFQCDDTERLRPRFRSERRESAVPEFGKWREWDGAICAGHFCTAWTSAACRHAFLGAFGLATFFQPRANLL